MRKRRKSATCIDATKRCEASETEIGWTILFLPAKRAVRKFEKANYGIRRACDSNPSFGKTEVARTKLPVIIVPVEVIDWFVSLSGCSLAVTRQYSFS